MVAKGGGMARTTGIAKKKVLAKNTDQKGKKRFIQRRRSVMNGTHSLIGASSGEPYE